MKVPVGRLREEEVRRHGKRGNQRGKKRTSAIFAF
jgi:hypothetical protein